MARQNQLSKIAKSLLKKARKDDADIYQAILNWRNTPTECSEYSPSQKLHSRRTRTTIPTTKELLQPEVAKNVADEILSDASIQNSGMTEQPRHCQN